MSNEANRPVFFELHIRPLFRLLDREHMLFFGDLWDYDTLMETPGGSDKTRAELLLDLLVAPAAGAMPPQTHGGPWPPEWIALYKRWMNEGYRRLAPGTATYKVKRQGDDVRLQGKGSAPSPGYEVWLNVEAADRTRPHFAYALFLKPPSTAESGEPTNFTANETIHDASRMAMSRSSTARS